MGILGIILGIVGLIAAFIATLFFGWMGGAAAILLGAVALVLGLLVRKKNGKGGIGAIVIGVIAVIVAVALIPTTQTMMKTIKENALKELDKQDSKFPVIAKYAEQADTNTGALGFLASLAGNVSEEDKAAFEEEAKNLASLLNESSSGSTPAQDKPAEEAPAEEAPAEEAPAEEPAAEPAG